MLEPTKSGQHTHPEKNGWWKNGPNRIPQIQLAPWKRSMFCWRAGWSACRASDASTGARRRRNPPSWRQNMGSCPGETFRKSPEFWEVRFWHGSFFLGFQHVDIELKCRNGIKWAYFPFRSIYLNFYRPLNNRLVWDDLGLWLSFRTVGFWHTRFGEGQLSNSGRG